MAKSEFTLAFNEITETHHLPRDIVVEALRQALVSAYRKDSSVSPAQHVEAEVDPLTNRYRILVEKEVVDSVINSQTEIAFDEARAISPTSELGDTIMAPEETNTKTFGRIAAQTAKQVILQKIREAERKSLFDEYKDREGDLVTGTVQSVTGQSVTLSLGGRAEAVMPYNQQIRGEKYRPHDKVRTLILEVKDSTRGPQIVVTRAHKNMLRRLLEYEVPEIYNGQVEIKSIAREPGHRSKVAVIALQPGVDPVGACVGMRGMRIQNIVKELNEEKIDVIEWSADPAIFIAKALSPARVSGVYLEEDIDQGSTATVIVPEDQLSLAIGREGQNARLAAKLTTWRIDIKSVTEAAFDGINRRAEAPFDKLTADYPEMIAEVERILEKKRGERTVTPEEYHTLGRFAQLAEQRLVDFREHRRSRRRKAFDKARSAVPKRAFQMLLEDLELERDIVQALKNRNITNVADLMMRLQAEPEQLAESLRAANANSDAMDAIRDSIESLVSQEFAAESQALADAVAYIAPVIDLPEVTEEQAVPEAENPALLAEGDVPAVAEAVEEADEEAPPAFVDDEVQRPVGPPPGAPRTRTGAPRLAPRPAAEPAPNYDAYVELGDQNQGDKSDKTVAASGDRKKDRKQKGRRREMIFDESRGEVVIKRKRKRGDVGWVEEEE